MKLFFKMSEDGKSLPQYHIEPIAAEHGANTQFAIRIMEAAEPQVVVPENKLIVPGN